MLKLIKFRAWDKEHKRVLNIGMLALGFSRKGVLKCIYNFGPDYSNDPDIIGDDEPDLDSVILEQFTSLTDVNGKEIYENDIIHVVTEDGYERNGKVIFEKGCYWVDNGMDKYPVNRVGCEQDILEVVGDAHTNPELIDFYNMKQLGD